MNDCQTNARRANKEKVKLVRQWYQIYACSYIRSYIIFWRQEHSLVEIQNIKHSRTFMGKKLISTAIDICSIQDIQFHTYPLTY